MSGTTYLVVEPPEPETPLEFGAEIIRDAIEILRVPAVGIAAAAVSFVPDVALAALRWPFHDTSLTPREVAITTMACLILAKAWFTLTVCHMGLAVLRNQPIGFFRQWVPVQTALRIGVVNIPLAAATLLATVLFVVPGVYLLAMWSQAPLAMVDGRSRWFDAANYSASLTDGFKPPIVVIWGAVLLLTSLVTFAIRSGLPQVGLGALTTPAGWALNAAAAAIGAALAASLYYNLEDRAPWNAPAPTHPSV